MPAAIEELIPHRPPMRWISALVECSATHAVATACFGENDFPVAGGKVLETALVECAAQTVAAALGQRGRERGRERGNSGAPANGMLVSVSNFKIQTRPPAGKTLRIEVRETKRLGPMLLVSAEISCEGQMVAAGELSLYA
jgi:predicted hotdog family 3-hydroxylacyl-ACP dehydratase